MENGLTKEQEAKCSEATQQAIKEILEDVGSAAFIKGAVAHLIAGLQAEGKTLKPEEYAVQGCFIGYALCLMNKRGFSDGNT